MSIFSLSFKIPINCGPFGSPYNIIILDILSGILYDIMLIAYTSLKVEQFVMKAYTVSKPKQNRV